MADAAATVRPGLWRRTSVLIGVVAILAVAIGTAAWFWFRPERVSTDDAQVDARVTQIAARIPGIITRVAVDDNRLVEKNAILVELDPRDYQVAVDKARAELADAEASALAARSNVPITTTTATSGVTTARGGVSEAEAAVAAAEKEVEAARARLTAVEAHLRE